MSDCLARIKNGAFFTMDMGMHSWPNVKYGHLDIVFKVLPGHHFGKSILISNNFGSRAPEENYGNGNIYINNDCLIPENEESKKIIDSKKILPCPFCECDIKEEYIEKQAEVKEYYVCCGNHNCCAEGPIGITLKEACEKWNKRR